MRKVYAIAILLPRFSPSFTVIHTPVSFKRNCDTLMETSEYGVACIIKTTIITIIPLSFSPSSSSLFSFFLFHATTGGEFDGFATRSDITLMSRDTPSLDTVTVDVHDVKCTWRRGEGCREEDTKIVSYRSVMHDSKGRRDSRTSFPDVSTVVYRLPRRWQKLKYTRTTDACVILRGNRLERLDPMVCACNKVNVHETFNRYSSNNSKVRNRWLL